MSTESLKNNEIALKYIEKQWGLPLSDVYKLAISFYKEKEGKALQLSYEDKLLLVAYTQQVCHGPLATSSVPPVGTLDVVGKDRRLAWQKLGNMSENEARQNFISLLNRRCPLFEAYVEAHRRDQEENKRKAKEEIIQLEKNEELRREHEIKNLEDKLKERKIKQALNEQTYEQFCIYAEQIYPGDPEKQSDLVKQLQEQHYSQYMQQLELQQMLNNKIQEISGVETASNESSLINENLLTTIDSALSPDDSQSISENDYELFENVQTASMWTLTNIEQFKKEISSPESNGLILKVSHGETITVRVPTNQNSSRLFWEFATDSYDIGFAVYFEWGPPKTDQVTVQVAESDDEDDVNEDEDIENLTSDLEGGLIKSNSETKSDQESSVFNQPILSEIVPLFRRDSHMEVYVGCHQFPGQGVYLLKFDNSYSLWRSKTLYYKIYYTNS